MSKPEATLMQAQKSYTSGEYATAGVTAQNAKQQALDISKAAAPAKSAIESAQKTIVAENTKGFYLTQADAALALARQAFARGDYTQATAMAQEASRLIRDIDKDGVPNESDFAPTIKNSYIYSVIAAVALIIIGSMSGIIAYRIRRRRLVQQAIEREKGEIIAMIYRFLGERK